MNEQKNTNLIFQEALVRAENLFRKCNSVLLAPLLYISRSGPNETDICEYRYFFTDKENPSLDRSFYIIGDVGSAGRESPLLQFPGERWKLVCCYAMLLTFVGLDVYAFGCSKIDTVTPEADAVLEVFDPGKPPTIFYAMTPEIFHSLFGLTP